MANAKVMQTKQEIVKDLTEKIKTASSGVLVDYKGITVAEDTRLRNELRKNDVGYEVVKNTLLRFASRNVGYDDMDAMLHGTTSLAMSSEDPTSAPRVIHEFARKINGKFEIKGGFIEGKVVSAEEIIAIAAIPPKNILYANVLGMMLAPITSLAIVLKAIAEKDGETAEATVAEVAAETAETEEPQENPANADETAATEAE